MEYLGYAVAAAALLAGIIVVLAACAHSSRQSQDEELAESARNAKALEDAQKEAWTHDLG